MVEREELNSSDRIHIIVLLISFGQNGSYTYLKKRIRNVHLSNSKKKKDKVWHGHNKLHR